jgi:hypothetical protein
MEREDLDLYFGHPAFIGEEIPDDCCPRCGHADVDHDEAGCCVCDCPGP